MAQLLVLFLICDYYTISIANLRFTGSNHYGIAGWYTRTALEHGLLVRLSLQSILCPSFFFPHMPRNNSVLFLQGMSFTNTSPLMGPTRAREVGGNCLLSSHSSIHLWDSISVTNLIIQNQWAVSSDPGKNSVWLSVMLTLCFGVLIHLCSVSRNDFTCFFVSHYCHTSPSNLSSIRQSYRDQVAKLHVLFRIGI